MNQETNFVRCPNCNFKLDVNDILYHQLDEELKKKYSDELAIAQKKFDNERLAIKTQKKELQMERSRLEDELSEKLNKALSDEKPKIQEKLKKQLAEEQSERLADLQKELDEKSKQVKELNRSRAEVERLKREKDELKDSMEVENQKKLNQMLAVEREKIRKTETEKATMTISEKDIVIKQLNDQLKAAIQKAEQGSTQLQGEAQELVIEEWLANEFPLDTIDEIKKGARGADCLQIVNTHSRQNCGSIYYESKRTKAFGGAWIEKFKQDIREKGANIGVLVTETMPNGMEQMGLVEGVWVCEFSEFKGLSHVLRESVIQLSRAVATQENRGDKMEMLYSFLTSNEFQHQVEGIVEGFTQMQSDLESEKRAMQGIWKKREKQIQKVLQNTTNMYGSVRGIAGSAIQPVPQLELPPPEEE
ncbi:MAG: DUF2130 domain-containing protein [Gammaproteobacteria bacterium]|nr:DUF2130 domain-containing protein [Gammaproteobacteria bacterium]